MTRSITNPQRKVYSMKAKARMSPSKVSPGSQTGASTKLDSYSYNPSQVSNRQLSLVPDLLRQDRWQDHKAVAGVSVLANYDWFRKLDANGRVSEERLYTKDDLLIFRWAYAYDDKGKKVQAELFDGCGSLLVICLYDGVENLAKRIVYREGKCDMEIKYDYDNRMRLVGSRLLEPNGSEVQTSHLLM